MKKYSQIIFLGMIIFCTLNCTTTKYTSDKLPEKQLIFGNGGGIAGIVTQYILLENGQIFKQIGLNGAVTEDRIIKKREAKKIFKESEKLGLATTKIEEKGNRYFFIKTVDGANNNELIWSTPNTVNKEIMSFYQSFMILLQ